MSPATGWCSTLRRLVIPAVVLSLLLLAPASADAHHCRTKGPPAAACGLLEKPYDRCGKVHPRSYVNEAKCHIRRAAVHYRQPVGDMIRVAGCESTYRFWIAGSHQGLYQYLWSTWATTPYARRSPYSPKWASMATGWMWAVGRRGEWACQ